MRTEPSRKFDPDRLVRPAIAKLKPYSSARNEFTGSARIFLDANENSLGSPTDAPYNRYPDPYQRKLKQRIAETEEVPTERLFIGNGSDEVIDLLFRVFCEPRIDNCIVCPPTYGMYEVSAGINDVEVRRAPLTADFGLNAEAVLSAADDRTKLVFLCSPNNPTGNSLDRSSMIEIADGLNALIVIDEAYIHFSNEPSFAREISAHANIVVMRTFSKAWGLAGLRLGFAIADPRIVELLNKVKPPYNVSEAAQKEALAAFGNEPAVRGMVDDLLVLRDELRAGLGKLPMVERTFPSDANFLLVKVPEPAETYRRLTERGIVVRDRSRVELCEGCLRITVGTWDENTDLLKSLKEIGEELI